MSAEPKKAHPLALTEESQELAPGVSGVLLAELTDEELAVLDGLTTEERFVVLPWLDTLSAEQRDIAMLAAFRGLVARGLAIGPEPGAVEAALQNSHGSSRSSVQVTVDETISAVLESRGDAHRVISCQRVHRQRQDFLYLFELRDADSELLLGELVVGTGLHRFFRIDDGDTATAVADYLTPEVWGEQLEPDVVVPAEVAAAGGASGELIASLDQSYLKSEVLVITEGRAEIPFLHAIFAGPSGVRTSSTRAGDGEPITFRSRDCAGFRQWIAEEILG